MAKLYNWSPGLCGALSATYNWRTFGLIIGKISKAKQSNKAHIEAWFDFNAKEAFVFAQVSAYFPTSWCLSMSVLLLLKTTKNLKASKPNLQQLNFWSSRDSDADSLLSFCFSHMLLLMVEDNQSFGGEGRKEEKGVFSRGVLIYKLLAFDLYQLCLLRQLGLKKISYKLAVFYCFWKKKNS